MIKPKALVLSAGATKGHVHLGALHKLYEIKFLDEVETYIGSSIGSAICLMLILGYTPIECFEIAITINLPIPKSPDMDALKNYGLQKNTYLEEKLKEIVLAKLPSLPTLKELYELTGKTLIAVACDVTTEKTKYFNHLTQPNLNCVQAILMSCNLPLFFQPILYGGHEYVDGGVTDPFPISYLDDGKTPIFGICIQGIHKDKTFFSYLYRLEGMPRRALTKLRVKNLSSMCTVLKIKVEEVNIFENNLHDNIALFAKGFAAMNEKVTTITVKKEEKCSKEELMEILNGHDFNRFCSEVDRNPKRVRKLLRYAHFAKAIALSKLASLLRSRSDIEDIINDQVAELTLFHKINRLFSTTLCSGFVEKLCTWNK